MPGLMIPTCRCQDTRAPAGFRRQARLAGVVLCVCMLTGCAIGTLGSASSNTVAGPVEEIDCDELDRLASLDSVNNIQLDFFNHRSVPISVSWVSYTGEEQTVGTILPGEEKTVNTFITHPWVLRDDTGSCLAVYMSDYPTRIAIR